MTTELNKLAQLIKEATTITVLTGAGISTASGIPDFRSADGIYTKVERVEYLLSETYYHLKPKLFWASFKDIFQLRSFDQYEPNAAHHFLAMLERHGKQVTVITQNVDGLHRKAGSHHILEVHGTVATAHCPKCKRKYSLEEMMAEEVPRCEQDQMILKPDVVLFEGQVQHVDEAFAAAVNCDLFITLGSSLEVYPINELPRYAAKATNTETALINMTPTKLDYLFDVVLHEELVDTSKKLQQLLWG